jgi:hypothetical protein
MGKGETPWLFAPLPGCRVGISKPIENITRIADPFPEVQGPIPGQVSQPARNFGPPTLFETGGSLFAAVSCSGGKGAGFYLLGPAPDLEVEPVHATGKTARVCFDTRLLPASFVDRTVDLKIGLYGTPFRAHSEKSSLVLHTSLSTGKSECADLPWDKTPAYAVVNADGSLGEPDFTNNVAKVNSPRAAAQGTFSLVILGILLAAITISFRLRRSSLHREPGPDRRP